MRDAALDASSSAGASRERRQHRRGGRRRAGETLVTGDAVNVAARLEQAAAPGEILLGEATQRLVRDAVRVEPVAPLDAEGQERAGPGVAAARARSTTCPRSRGRSEAPFVGREASSSSLSADARDARSRHGRAAARHDRRPARDRQVAPRARAGRELAPVRRVVVGRCLSYGEGITYWPLAEIAAQIGDLRAALEGTDDAELAARPRGPSRSGRGSDRLRRRRSPGASASCSRRSPRARPLVVVFDDIHWAEPTLLDLIEYVADLRQGVPICPALHGATRICSSCAPAWTTPRPNAPLLTLEPLAEADERGARRRSSATSPAETRRAASSTTAEGNPLFVEQLVAMQRRERERQLEVPPTLQALLAARIDRLGRAGAGSRRARLRGGTALPSRRRRRAAACPRRSELGANLITLVRKELIRPDRADAPRRRRLPVRPRPDPRRRLRGDSEAATRGAPRALRALARRPGSATRHPTRSSATTSSRRTATASSSARPTRHSASTRLSGSRRARGAHARAGTSRPRQTCSAARSS